MNFEPRYAAFFCEENVWWLLRDHPWRGAAFALVLTNPARSCAVFAQQKAPTPLDPVVWDYHVVALETCTEGRARVFDLDSIVAPGASFADYAREALLPSGALPKQFRPHFRLIPRRRYLEGFRSDRSHMRDQHGAWKAPPPSWPEIKSTSAGRFGLERMLDLHDRSVGSIHSLDELMERFGGET